MNLSKTLELVRQKEKANGRLLESALLLKRYYSRSDFNMLRCAESFYLPVVNAKARIKWATAFIEQTFRYFGLDENDEGPATLAPIFLFFSLARVMIELSLVACSFWMLNHLGHGATVSESEHRQTRARFRACFVSLQYRLASPHSRNGEDSKRTGIVPLAAIA
jgi:hypothetical protein